MLALAAKPTPAEYTIQVLREKYLAFPQATTLRQREATLNADIAQSMRDTLCGANSRNVRFLVGGEKPASLIDIGCAEGQKTSALAEAWGLPRQDAIGLGIVPVNSLPSNIDFQMMSPNTLPESILYNSQDLAIVSIVLHHSTEPCALLQSIHSALRRGGYLIIREYNANARRHMANFLNTDLRCRFRRENLHAERSKLQKPRRVSGYFSKSRIRAH
jgi:SAM-dependent methyltransferase